MDSACEQGVAGREVVHGPREGWAVDGHMTRTEPDFKLLSSLLFFIFGGTIVGETVALSMVVGVVGPGVLSKLYLINGFLLFLLPPLFFRYIDRFNRGKLLHTQLVVSAALLLLYLPVLGLVSRISVVCGRAVLLSIYPLSYLAKTVLFLTFWTLANDVSYTFEAKREFPRISAWGILGGLCGAGVARVLLIVFEPVTIVGLWAIAYVLGIVVLRRILRQYRARLRPREYIPGAGPVHRVAFADLRSVLSSKLVRLLAALYFQVFLGVFLLDYLFWKKCHELFETSAELASFQFSFYMGHSVVTILGLAFITPRLIGALGFPRLFMFLPVTLMCGSVLLLGVGRAHVGLPVAFGALAAVQFLRYVVYENGFSPVYQMFFVVIPREKRGRVKTVLEGAVKPSAIILAGILLLVLDRVTYGILFGVLAVSVGLIWTASRIRSAYMSGLVVELPVSGEPERIISEIGSRDDQKILFLVGEFSRSPDVGMRRLAVRILAQVGTESALEALVVVFAEEDDGSVKELIARSLSRFPDSEIRPFIELLLKDGNQRVRGNALHSLNNLQADWKWELRGRVRPLLFENSIRVQIEAARFLWHGDVAERQSITAFLQYLTGSRSENKRSAGLYLTSLLKPERWEETLAANLRSASPRIFHKSMAILLQTGSPAAGLEALRTAEHLSRKHIGVTGAVVREVGAAAVDTVVAFLKHATKRRMIFEMVHSLRMLRDTGVAHASYRVDGETAGILTRWIESELERVYLDSCCWVAWQGELPSNMQQAPCVLMLEDALHEQLFRVCLWALDTVALVEAKGAVALGRRDLDLTEHAQRLDMVEIVASFAPPRLRERIIPILALDSWNTIARRGRQFVRFDETKTAGLSHFLRSENRWVCLCALFCLVRVPEREALLRSQRNVISGFADDAHPYLSRAAAQTLILGRTAGEPESVDTFDLLETVLFFKKTVLFRNVPAEKLMGLAEIVRSVSYGKGTVISKEGDISDHLYIVRRGSLRIDKTRNNTRVVLSIVRSGESYGEIGLFNQSPRSATAIANEDCELLVVQRAALKKLLLDMPEIAYNFLEVFGEKLRKSSEEIALLHTTLTGKMHDSNETRKGSWFLISL